MSNDYILFFNRVEGSIIPSSREYHFSAETDDEAKTKLPDLLYTAFCRLKERDSSITHIEIGYLVRKLDIDPFEISQKIYELAEGKPNPKL